MKKLLFVLVTGLLLTLILTSGVSADPAWNIPIRVDFRSLGCGEAGTYVTVQIQIVNPYNRQVVKETTVKLEPGANCRASYNWQFTPDFASWTQGNLYVDNIVYPSDPNWKPVWVRVTAVEWSANVHVYQKGVPRHWDEGVVPGATSSIAMAMKWPNTLWGPHPQPQVCWGPMYSYLEWDYAEGPPFQSIGEHYGACQTRTFGQWYANWSELSAGNTPMVIQFYTDY
jgi:hypothetical protein